MLRFEHLLQTQSLLLSSGFSGRKNSNLIGTVLQYIPPAKVPHSVAPLTMAIEKSSFREFRFRLFQNGFVLWLRLIFAPVLIGKRPSPQFGRLSWRCACNWLHSCAQSCTLHDKQPVKQLKKLLKLNKITENLICLYLYISFSSVIRNCL